MENPRLIIADEPTPGMELALAKKAMEDFRRFADAGNGVLLITHDIELALEVADRIAVFYAGTTVEEALVGDFASQELLRHPYTRALWRLCPGTALLPLTVYSLMSRICRKAVYSGRGVRISLRNVWGRFRNGWCAAVRCAVSNAGRMIPITTMERDWNRR